MNTSRILVSLAAGLTLSLTACGGTEESLTEAPDTGDVLVSTEQGLGIPPNCPNGDLYYWFENIQGCLTCGTVRNPGQLATQYAACRSNVTGTRTLINTKYCITGCDPL
ncbi:hypothetical protein JY651_05505 [Pyxidicoccus parkwayensis]|uniref:Lipoprotein n=1 Tax=Pyxidicoccus parkwayensis TaxID=2813578 RepID=A0ABX7P139_9BACT|nr:hypothetical protein [Pyxidicoccus parkwaysis]QSQ24414.1 hypothetical protein JY651_05505 [Pyxidicoccus parkwaysis]